MRLLECLLQKNGCYKKYHGVSYQPTGIVVHSTDKAGKIIKRFVQPYEGQTTGLLDNGKAVTANQMISILGKNIYANDWNREKIGTTTLEACVHAFLGQVADGSYAVCKTLPYTCPCWGAGSGKSGSYNGCYKGNATPPLYIQFEMIEDNGTADAAHCKKLYDLAVEYCASLCKQFPTIKLSNIVSHKEAHAKGRGSNHGDPENYWQRCGMSYTMAGFRRDVEKALAAQNAPTPTVLPFTDVEKGSYYEEAVRWAYENGITTGTSKTKFSPDKPVTRGQMVVFLQRLYRLLGKT